MQFSQEKKRMLVSACVSGAILLALLGGMIFWAVRYSQGIIDQQGFFRRGGYALICIAVIALVYAVQAIFRFRFPLFLELTVFIFSFLCLGGGTVFGLYGYIAFWDKILHTLSGFVFSALGLTIASLLVGKEMFPTRKAILLVLIAFLFSLAVGYLWEIYEFTFDSLFGANLQRWQQGVIESLPDGTFLVTDARGTAIQDTLWDMILNLIGTAVFLIPALTVFLKKPSAMEAFTLTSTGKKKKTDVPTEERS